MAIGIEGLRPDTENGLIGGFLSRPEIEEKTLEIDTFEEVYQLEVEAEAIDFIRGWYSQADSTPKERALAPLTKPMHSVQYIANQFAKRILPVFMEQDTEVSLVGLREIVPHTTLQEMVLLINDDEFRTLHTELHRRLEDNAEIMARNVQHRLIPDPELPGTFARADRHQFTGIETPRSLENILDNGLELSINPEDLERLKQAHEQAGEGTLPISELLKNHKILNIVGFSGSKISLAVHDAIDHAWLYSVLRDRGYLQDYAGLLNSIGNPHLTDMFSREGETLASISYGVRYFSTVENGFQPLVDTTEIIDIAERLLIEGRLTEPRHIRAYTKLKSIKPNSKEWQSLGFTFSNYLVELDEQRRKHGKIKQRDDKNKIVGELDPLSPDFLSLFIETHHELHMSSNKHRDTLFRFHIMLEEFLANLAGGKIDPTSVLHIKVQDLKDIDFSQTSLPTNRLHWMRQNYGYTAVKDCVY